MTSTVKLEGWEQLNWLIRRFGYDVEHALDVMYKHKQDMSFLKEYLASKELENKR